MLGEKRYERYFGKEKGEKLKELLGHTPFEVLIGCIVGIVIGFGMLFFGLQLMGDGVKPIMETQFAIK